MPETRNERIARVIREIAAEYPPGTRPIDLNPRDKETYYALISIPRDPEKL